MPAFTVSDAIEIVGRPAQADTAQTRFDRLTRSEKLDVMGECAALGWSLRTSSPRAADFFALFAGEIGASLIEAA